MNRAPPAFSASLGSEKDRKQLFNTHKNKQYKALLRLNTVKDFLSQPCLKQSRAHAPFFCFFLETSPKEQKKKRSRHSTPLSHTTQILFLFSAKNATDITKRALGFANFF
jgi:hypothetical protein